MTEFIRKIDSTGRIVIPKDLRKLINIKDDDYLEINVNNSHIELHKHLYDDKLQKTVNFINLTKDLINGIILVTSKDSIINDNEMVIPNDIINIIDCRKEFYSKSIVSYNFKKEVLSGYYSIVPLLKDSELIGSIIIIKDCILNDGDYLYINIIKRFVDNLNYL